LVFIGATADDLLHAYDIENGDELWRGELPGRGKATPMTYRARDGRQYVAIAAGSDSLAGRGAAIVAFALP
jgi:quinoprotein glucose dehydrogenase